MTELKGMRESIRRENRHLAWLLVAGFVLIAEYAAVFETSRQFNSSSIWFDHTTFVIAKLEELSTDIKEMERGQRGFLLTRKQDYIVAYHEAAAEIPNALRSLSKLTADNPRQQRRIAALDSLLREKMEQLNASVVQRKSGPLLGALGIIIQTDSGERAMRSIKVLTDGIRNEEYALLKGRTTATRRSKRIAFEIMTVGSIVLLALIAMSAVLIRRGNYRAAQLMGMAQQEIKERQQAQEALRESEDRFRTMANCIPQLAWTANADGFIFWYNQRWYEYTGTTPQQMEGWGWQCVHDPKTLPAVMERWNSSLVSGQPLDMEFPLRGADGQFRVFLNRVQPLKDSEGRVIQWFGTNTDISDRQQAEAAIQQMNQDLEERVAVRTADLVSSNQELEALAYSVSHDLRAPIRHMDGFSALLRKNCHNQLNASGNRYLDKISSSSKKMGRLIDDLLAFSRLRRAEVTRTQVDLQQLEQEARAAVEPDTAGRKMVWLVGELPKVYGDRPMLRQVFINLLSNAVKYTRERSEARIEIGSLASAAETTVFVRDNGAGFDMEYADKLFQVFQRLHTAEEFEGTGVGLANVRRIVERHGGKVWAESVVDEGATFYFSLPQSGEPEAKG